MERLGAVGLGIIFIIIFIFLLSIITTIVISISYMKISNELNDAEAKNNLKFKSDFLNSIVTSFKMAIGKKDIEVNTQALIENRFYEYYRKAIFGERFLNNAVSLMIILGLMGTFYGLTLSIDKLSVFLQGNTDSIVTGLINGVQGMAVAFTTSLFGIGCSVLLTLIKIIYSVKQKREDIMVQIEEYLDNYVAQVAKVNQLNEYEKIVEALEQTFKDFGRQLVGDYRKTSEKIAANLAAATSGVEHASLQLSDGIQKFDNSLVNFSENTRDFSEFNYQLRTNIDRLNIAFADFTEVLKEQKEVAK